MIAGHHPPGLSLPLPERISSVTDLTSAEARKGHLIVAPMAFGGKRLGFFVVATQDEVSECHRRLVELLSLQIATVLRTAEYTRRLRTFADKLEKLHRAAMGFNRLTDEREVCTMAVEVLEKFLGFDYCSVDFLEGEYLVPMCSSSKTGSIKPRPFRIDEGLTGLTFREGRTFWGDDVHKVPEARPVAEEIRSFISVPIGEYGVIQIVSKEAGAFSEEDVKLVEILAQQMYEAIKRIRLEREIREQAVRDPLTGLYNRRYFDIFVELYRERGEGPLSLCILDMDGFKAINDRFGHAVGDEVLAAIAGLLRDNVRSDDVVIRWGGDEFLVLMPRTGAEEARRVVERLKRVVRSWSHPGHPEIRLGFTAGVATWDPLGGEGIDEALRMADEELYARRRNRGGGDELKWRGKGGE